MREVDIRLLNLDILELKQRITALEKAFEDLINLKAKEKC